MHLSRPAVKGGEIISVRGLGKFRYTGAGNQTKKGRLSSMPKIYIVRKYMPKVTIRFRAVKLEIFTQNTSETPLGIAAVTVTAQIRIRRNDYEWQKYI